MPIHRWFHYYAGFSAQWLGGLLRERSGSGRLRVLDPFAGSGTALIEAERAGAEAIGLEPHPFINRVARAKLLWREDAGGFVKYCEGLVADARTERVDVGPENTLLQRCYAPDVLGDLVALRTAWLRRADGAPTSELAWLALSAALRDCTAVSSNQGQYILPNHAKMNGATGIGAFEARYRAMVHDMVLAQAEGRSGGATILQEDARSCRGVPSEWADFVVTSPPYANNYDYADATRLEMTFFGEVERWGDLQDIVRRHLLRSSTQHVSKDVSQTFAHLQDELLRPIRDELAAVCQSLVLEREEHGGKKNYHTMLVLYFLDLAAVWRSLRRVVRAGGEACFVIGDSAPYGVYVPVERWLAELALASGFRSWRFEKLRDRNVKWKNRKHRVPLKEGLLWVAG
jgi:hypothetical protein